MGRVRITRRNHKDIDHILRVIAEEKNMPYRKVRRAYMLYWRFIKDFMVGYQMDNIGTEEDYLSKPYSVAVSKLGTIYCDYKKIKKLQKRKELYGNSIEESNTDVQWDSDNV